MEFLFVSRVSPLYRFGSTYGSNIRRNGVHYDCGCIISHTGELANASPQTTPLNKPIVYVVYFSTFGAMAWHLLLYEKAVENLYGPILSPYAINDTTADVRMSGNNQRTKVCHFVRARLFSTFNFLSIHYNQSQNDACILLNSCIERMALSTINQRSSWIKASYGTLAENSSLKRSYIDELHLQSQIQMALQKYSSRIPIVIQMSHFTTEWYNPKYSELSLNIIQLLLHSTDRLKITAHIYNLCRFYFLLHQTYSQMIERGKCEEITLKELYKRAKEHLKTSNKRHYENEMKIHWQIIEKGIEAVNAYHKSTDGYIRPGACNETQRFFQITEDTPVSYLVTTENYDEGNIIMCILSILIDYHNSFLDTIEHEFDSYEHKDMNTLKYLIGKIVPKEVSIIQVVRENTGVISLNGNDCLWIEKLALANRVVENEIFPTYDTKLNFDYLNVQSYIIRTYLLLCHIKYQDIAQKYMYFVPRKIMNAVTMADDEMFKLNENYSIPLETDWDHLNEMPIDQLYHSYNVLRQIASTLKNESNDRSIMDLHDYIETIEDKDLIVPKMQECKVQNFQLCHMNHVSKLYKDLVGRFEHLFTDTSSLLQIPISTELSNQLNDRLKKELINIDNNIGDKTMIIQKMESNMQDIDQLLDELKEMEETLVETGTATVTKMCKDYLIKSPLLQIIGEEIQCRNYVSLNIILIQIRYKLQEKIINIEAANTKQWNENFDEASNQTEQQNRRNRFCPIEGDDTEQDDASIFKGRIKHRDSDDKANEIVDEPSSPLVENVEIPSLFELAIEPIPIASLPSILADCDQSNTASGPQKKVHKFDIKRQPDGKFDSYTCKIETIYTKLKDHMTKKKYDINKNVVVDSNKIFIDFTRTDARLPNPLPLEYEIVERTLLVPIRLLQGQEEFEYLALSDCSVLSIIRRFVDEHDRKPSSSEFRYCFCDELGRYIDNGTIVELSRMNRDIPIVIVVTEENMQGSVFYAVTLRTKEGQEQKSLFHPTTKWQNIDIWRKTHLQQIDSSCVFWNQNNKTIVDENQSISMLEENSIALDGISQDQIRDVTFLFGSKTQVIRALKSIRIHDLLNNGNLQQLNLHVSPKDCILMLGESDDQILSTSDMQKSLEEYVQPIQFRISVKFNVFQYDIQRNIEIRITDSDITVDQVLHMKEITSDAYKYLTSSDRNIIIANDQKIADLNQTEFIVLKENETCYVSIENSIDAQVDGSNTRYAIFATIADVLKNSNISVGYLLHSNDFVPSAETKLTSFISPIQFQVIKDNLPIVVTIVNMEQGNCSITFNCSNSITVERIFKISCELLNVDQRHYCLKHNDSEIDVEMSLEDLEPALNNFHFQLSSTFDMKCSIRYNNETFRLPCSKDATTMDLAKEIFQKFHISDEEIHQFEIQLILNDDTKSALDMDLAIEDIISLHFENEETPILLFELTKKVE
ncbi:unnamed protein product [Rotaria socialis]|uniref:Uncharacterized protein n=2 Tax=Rotaria socialis TaxID=392032 RepID=A0A820X1T3_9BILA|nr:unnamed protein product [Rotaria socialis]